MKQKDRTIVSAVIISKDQRLLLGKVREGGVYPNCWHIPGGGVNDGETKKVALIREIKEEVGLDLSGCPNRLLSNTDTGEAVKVDRDTGEKYVVRMHFNVYQVDLNEDSSRIKISLGDDLREYKWVSKSELGKYKHTPPSEKLFRKLRWL